MLRLTVVLLIAVLAWPVREAAAVICDPSAMEAMPCCEQSMGDCGMPGMTGDCCIVVPGDELPAASSLTLDSASICRDHLASLVAVVVPVPAPELYVIQVREAASARPPSYAEPFFVRTSVLRI